jgi:putative hydrolase of the HAD superfamily
MSQVDTLFWDVGGVLLTNGWDRAARGRAVRRFGLDSDEFGERHELVAADFETGRLSLENYLRSTVFCRPRSFGETEFVQFMLAQSHPLPESIALLRALRAQRRYRMVTLNNESAELNEYRLRHFGLRDCFDAFFSSCYLGVRKPAADIYRLALQLTQREPDRCVFIDDRALNLESAARLGIHTIEFRGATALREELARLGVVLEAPLAGHPVP